MTQENIPIKQLIRKFYPAMNHRKSLELDILQCANDPLCLDVARASSAEELQRVIDNLETLHKDNKKTIVLDSNGTLINERNPQNLSTY